MHVFTKEIATYRKKGTDNLREESVTEDPEEEPITVNSKRTISLISLRNLLRSHYHCET